MKTCPVCQKNFPKPRKYSATQWMEMIHCSRSCRDLSPEYRARLSAAHKGKLNGPEFPAKMSAIRGMAWKNQEYRTKLMTVFRSPEVRAKRSAEARERYRDPAFCAKRLVALRTAESRSKLSVSQKRRFTDPKERAVAAIGALKGRMAGRLAKPSSIETTIRTLLDRIGISYLKEHRIGPYLADIFIPSKNLVIECDGSYWHSRPGVKDKDEKRDAYMVSRGYTVLRLPENEIREGRAEEHVLRAVAG